MIKAIKRGLHVYSHHLMFLFTIDIVQSLEFVVVEQM